MQHDREGALERKAADEARRTIDIKGAKRKRQFTRK